MAKLEYDSTGRLLFTEEMRKEYTLLMPQMLPVHFGMMRKMLECEGYKVDMLTTNHRGIVDEGLKYVHNDTCYPALLVIGQLLDAVKTKRYAYARLRRMALWAYLGITPGGRPESVPYLRVLAANERGRALLGEMKKTAALPVITKPAQARQLGEEGRRLFELEARATDLYALAYPKLAAAGSEWTESPVIL